MWTIKLLLLMIVWILELKFYITVIIIRYVTVTSWSRLLQYNLNFWIKLYWNKFEYDITGTKISIISNSDFVSYTHTVVRGICNYNSAVYLVACRYLIFPTWWCRNVACFPRYAVSYCSLIMLKINLSETRFFTWRSCWHSVRISLLYKSNL